MLKLGKSILGAALLAGLTTTAVVAPTRPADARPVFAPHAHWVHGWHNGRYGWWWSGPDFWYWYPAPVYYDYAPPPPDYVEPAGAASQATWYYCDSAKGYYPYVRACSTGWRAVAANPQGQSANAQPPAPPPPSGAGNS
jgi:hypothetical protein